MVSQASRHREWPQQRDICYGPVTMRVTSSHVTDGLLILWILVGGIFFYWQFWESALILAGKIAH